jgi:DNA polymerase-3 subunit beta
MKAIIDSQVLSRHLKKVSPAIKKTTVLPILSCVLLRFKKNVLTIQATDLETTIVISMECSSNEEFDVLMEYADLYDVCSKINEPLSIRVEGKTVNIISDSAKFTFSTFGGVETFPPTPKDTFDIEVDVDSTFFSSLFCAYQCIGGDTNRRMAGVSVQAKKDKIVVAGTDALVAYRHSLNIKTSKISEVLVPGTFVQMVKGVDTAKLYIGSKFIKAESDSVTIISLLFEEKFVALDTIIPTEISYNFVIKREDFVAALGLTGIAANPGAKIIAINFLPNGVKLTSQDVAFGKEAEATVKAIHDIQIDRISVNGLQILKLLNIFDSAEVEMSFGSQTKTVFLRPSGEPNVVCLLQPVILL